MVYQKKPVSRVGVRHKRSSSKEQCDAEKIGEYFVSLAAEHYYQVDV